MYFCEKQEKIGTEKCQMLKLGKKPKFWDSAGS